MSNIDIVRRVNGNVFGKGGGGWEILYHGDYKSRGYYKFTFTEIY